MQAWRMMQALQAVNHLPPARITIEAEHPNPNAVKFITAII